MIHTQDDQKFSVHPVIKIQKVNSVASFNNIQNYEFNFSTDVPSCSKV